MMAEYLLLLYMPVPVRTARFPTFKVATEPEESHHVNGKRKRSVPLKVEAKKDTQVQVLATDYGFCSTYFDVAVPSVVLSNGR